MPRFVILEHHHQGVHWDFMLESGETLRTWRLETAPQPGQSTAATPLPDHRRVYLDYEGEISGGRGHVIRWDAGDFEWVADQPDRVEVRLVGRRVRGDAYLLRDESGAWTFRLVPRDPSSGEPAVR